MKHNSRLLTEILQDTQFEQNAVRHIRQMMEQELSLPEAERDYPKIAELSRDACELLGIRQELEQASAAGISRIQQKIHQLEESEEELIPETDEMPEIRHTGIYQTILTAAACLLVCLGSAAGAYVLERKLQPESVQPEISTEATSLPESELSETTTQSYPAIRETETTVQSSTVTTSVQSGTAVTESERLNLSVSSETAVTELPAVMTEREAAVSTAALSRTESGTERIFSGTFTAETSTRKSETTSTAVMTTSTSASTTSVTTITVITTTTTVTTTSTTVTTPEPETIPTETEITVPPLPAEDSIPGYLYQTWTSQDISYGKLIPILNDTPPSRIVQKYTLDAPDYQTFSIRTDNSRLWELSAYSVTFRQRISLLQSESALETQFCIEDYWLEPVTIADCSGYIAMKKNNIREVYIGWQNGEYAFTLSASTDDAEQILQLAQTFHIYEE